MRLKNRVQLIGNIGNEVELLAVGSTHKVAFSMATNETYKKKDTGEKVTEVTWHNIEAWGKTAEIISKWFKKGDPIMIEGKLTQQTWEHEGKKHYKTVVKISDFEFIGGKQNSSTDSQGSSTTHNNNDEEDDLPF